jgi:hypothetical protein
MIIYTKTIDEFGQELNKLIDRANMFTLYQVITNGGDGSNGLQYTTDSYCVEWMQDKADNGDEYYASGDGLQVRELKFKSKESLDEFIELNVYNLFTMSDIKAYDEIY